jgi:OOP family OmpA-OmpF porin
MVRKMRVSRYLLVFSILASMILMGCATTQTAGPVVKAGDLTMKMKSGKYVQNANNFDIIVDKTGSMGSDYAGVQKFIIEKSLVSKFNSYIPDVTLNGGLRTLGQNYADFDVTKLVYGMAKYDADSLEGVIRNLSTPYGDSPLEAAILAAGNDLKGLQGRSALVIFSDGVDMGDASVKAAANVKSQYGDKLCIYTVLIGNDKQGAKVLEQISKAGQCGISVKGDDLADDSAMNNFVERIFLAHKKGVMKEAAVQREAPASKEVSIGLLVEFDTGMAIVKPKYNNEIKKVADFMKEYPDANAVIEGHTDNVGKEAANIKLSQRRADSIKTYLVKKFGIDSSRIKTIGYGLDKPVASNATKEGRQKNRRVNAVFSNMTK